MDLDFPFKVFPPVYSAGQGDRDSVRRTTSAVSHPSSAITLRSGRRLQPRGSTKASMDSLPTEMLEMILMWDVRMCRSEKNTILPLRLVCKAFDRALAPYIFRTMQLEFSRFVRNKTPLSVEALARHGDLCNAVYIDMMVIRDEEEINRLGEVFQSIMSKVPEMTIVLSSLRKYCMNETTFDEADYKRMVDVVLQATPNMTRLKLNLPFQVVGRSSQTATLLLANTLAAIAQRRDDFSKLETLVLDHVSDTTINTICNNPIDLGYARSTFESLKHLVLSIKRQESRQTQMALFVNHIWFLIMRATKLETLCIVGWNVQRDSATRQHLPSVTFNEWMMRSFPFFLSVDTPQLGLNNLRCLELKRVDIDPLCLQKLIESIKSSLKELYLNEVYMKVFGSSELEKTPLWIGHGPSVRKPEKCIWLAEDLRNMEGLSLEVLRATQLGYDDFDPDKNSAYPNYDNNDTTNLKRSFDQRFVEAVFGIDVEMKDTSSDASSTSSEMANISRNLSVLSQELAASTENITTLSSQASLPLQLQHHASSAHIPSRDETMHSILRARRNGLNRVHKIRTKVDYDAKTYQLYRNVTSHFKTCIDGLFMNHNEAALKELQKISTVADRGMALLSAEILMAHVVARDNATGGGTGGTGAGNVAG